MVPEKAPESVGSAFESERCRRATLARCNTDTDVKGESVIRCSAQGCGLALPARGEETGADSPNGGRKLGHCDEADDVQGDLGDAERNEGPATTCAGGHLLRPMAWEPPFGGIQLFPGEVSRCVGVIRRADSPAAPPPASIDASAGRWIHRAAAMPTAAPAQGDDAEGRPPPVRAGRTRTLSYHPIGFFNNLQGRRRSEHQRSRCRARTRREMASGGDE